MSGKYFSYFSTKNISSGYCPESPQWGASNKYQQDMFCCGYSLEVPWQGTSNEYQQHMILWRSKKNINKYSVCFQRKQMPPPPPPTTLPTTKFSVFLLLWLTIRSWSPKSSHFCYVPIIYPWKFVKNPTAGSQAILQTRNSHADANANANASTNRICATNCMFPSP